MEELPPEQRIALAWTPPKERARLAAIFALDQRLSRIVAQATEPLLAQIRLAWWRDALAKPVGERSTGDAVLDAIGVHWSGGGEALSYLVDAWEEMLGEQPLTRTSAKSFAYGRSIPFAHLAGPQPSDTWQRAQLAAARWALADAAAHLSNDVEREMFIELGLSRASIADRVRKHLRGLAVLEALALRSLKAGARPLMEGRGAALLALRVGIFGR